MTIPARNEDHSPTPIRPAPAGPHADVHHLTGVMAPMRAVDPAGAQPESAWDSRRLAALVDAAVERAITSRIEAGTLAVVEPEPSITDELAVVMAEETKGLCVIPGCTTAQTPKSHVRHMCARHYNAALAVERGTTCKEQGCDTLTHCRDYCKRHYDVHLRWQRAGRCFECGGTEVLALGLCPQDWSAAHADAKVCVAPGCREKPVPTLAALCLTHFRSMVLSPAQG